MNAEEGDIVLTPLSAGKVYNLLIAERVVDGYVVFSGKQKGLLTMKEFPFQRGDVVKGFYKGTDKKKTGFFVPVRTSDIEGSLVCLRVLHSGLTCMRCVGGREFDKSRLTTGPSRQRSKAREVGALKPFDPIWQRSAGRGLRCGRPCRTPTNPRRYAGRRGRLWVTKELRR